MATVLVIDDDVSLQRALKVALQLAGYKVIAAMTGEQGIAETAVAARPHRRLAEGLCRRHRHHPCSKARRGSHD